MSVDHFRVGYSTSIYGRSIKVIGVDQYTREFYENIGITHAADESYPQD
jgi:hypothetical protein